MASDLIAAHPGEARILSYRILSYEREDDGFKPVDAYPRLSLACISTHDHQTLAGRWRSADSKARAEHGIVPAGVSETHIEARQHEGVLKLALDASGAEPLARLPPAQERGAPPSTTDSYPNWKPKLTVSIEDLEDLLLVREISEAMRHERSGGV
ncbi:4-alpha-glucanotransferase [Pararhizobium sp. DWP1-1-3]|uniref:4-alpha-glucanotransferase n=1 Tax=Pararhizobium sp. DWP1-1-3 TaxID=2804652 RepID=UPI003CECD118